MPTITSGSEVLPVTASGWTVPSARTRTLSSLLIDVSLRTSDGEMVVLVEVVLVDVLLVELDVEDGTEVAPATVVVGAAVVVVVDVVVVGAAVVVVVEVVVVDVVVVEVVVVVGAAVVVVALVVVGAAVVVVAFVVVVALVVVGAAVVVVAFVVVVALVVVGAAVVVVALVVVGLTVVVVDVVVVAGGIAPQNWTLEMSGVLPPPTLGRPALENVPLEAGGVNVAVTEPGPPLTIRCDTGLVDVQVPPSSRSLPMFTTLPLPEGPSKS
mgnify:CR=1 FL=1